MNEDIPTEADWGEWQEDLDAAHTHNRFAGRTLEEAEQLFAAFPLGASEDLESMPRVPFRFYLRALASYVLSEASRGEPDGASCFLRTIERKLADEPGIVLPMMPWLLDSLRQVAARQSFYESDLDIYGDFAQAVAAILAACERQP